MRAVILAGGGGTRINNPEKCLMPVWGVPILFRVVGALQWAGFRELVVATTARHSGVAWAAGLWGLEVAYTQGMGYERDFKEVVDRYAPALVVSCDLADLTPRHVAPLLKNAVMATAVSGGRYVGLSWAPKLGEAWVDVEVPPLLNINTWQDLKRAEEAAPLAYPLVVQTEGLLPHEETEGELRLEGWVAPIVVDVWTCTVLDGHHRLRALKEAGLPAPVLPVDYRRIDVNLDKLLVLSRAAAGAAMPPRSTWHTYKNRHVSEIPTAAAPLDFLKSTAPLRCRPS